MNHHCLNLTKTSKSAKAMDGGLLTALLRGDVQYNNSFYQAAK